LRKKSKVTLICVTGIIIILTLRVFFILNSVGNGFAKYLTTQYPKLSFKVDSTKINFLYSNYYAKVTCLSDGTVFWISKNFNTKDISEDYYQYKSTSEYNSNLKDIFDGSDIQKYIASITGGSKSLFTENATYEQINVQLVNDVNPIDPIRVLIVDDSPILLETIAFALSMRGFTVETAEDGIKGLERAMAMQPTCIIIDVKMPGLNGLQLVRALRGDPATEHIPLIILSAMVQETDQLAGMFSGADQYLMKPINPQALEAAIHRAIALDAEARDARLRGLAEGGK